MQIIRLYPLERILGDGALNALLSGCPTLLRHDPATLLLNLEAAQGIIPIKKLLAVYKCVPALLSYPPFRLWGSVATLADLAGCDVETAGQMAARQPHLLLVAPGTLQQRSSQLAELLCLKPEPCKRIVRGAPALLTYHSCTLYDKLAALSSIMGDRQHLLPVIRRQPLLLTLDSAGLAARLAQLSVVLALPQQRLLTLLLRQPAIMTLAVTTVAQKVDVLLELTQLPPERVSQLIEGSPMLLTTSASSIREKWGLLQQGLSHCDCWRQQMREGSPKTLGLFLCFSKQRLGRLQHVADTHGSQGLEQVKWRKVLMMTDLQFEETYPSLQWQACTSVMPVPDIETAKVAPELLMQ